MLTTERIANGLFDVSWNGTKTNYQIYNGSEGMSGKGRNDYGIYNKESGKRKIIGSLQKAKKTLELTFKKNPPTDTETWEPLSEAEQEEKIQQELQIIRLRKHSK